MRVLHGGPYPSPLTSHPNPNPNPNPNPHLSPLTLTLTSYLPILLTLPLTYLLLTSSLTYLSPLSLLLTLRLTYLSTPLDPGRYTDGYQNVAISMLHVLKRFYARIIQHSHKHIWLACTYKLHWGQNPTPCHVHVPHTPTHDRTQQ